MQLSYRDDCIFYILVFKFYGDFVNKNGQVVGSDGINDGKVYVLKTTESEFDKGVPGAGLSKEMLNETIRFIEGHSGNISAFESNRIAYDNSIEIEGSPAVRKAMVDIVNQDSGKGGRSDANNREYGGSINGGIVTQATPGAINKLSSTGKAHIALMKDSNTSSTFHSHPSGTLSSANPTSLGVEMSIKQYDQSPSWDDLSTSGGTTNYVFGRGNNTVYIYNSQGIQAIVGQKNFINFKR